MKTCKLAISALLLIAGVATPVKAAPEPAPKELNVYEISLQDFQGNEVKIFGTKEQIQFQIEKLQQEALTLAAQVIIGDDCRLQACFKQVVDVSTGLTELIALSESEILQREKEVLERAQRVQSLVDSAGLDYQVRAEAVLAIPINIAGMSRTIQGNLNQISEEVARLRFEAEALKSGQDPCLIETCYKTIVDLHWGLAPATTSTIPLTEEDLAQRAIDRNRQITQAEALASAAEEGLASGASPVYQFSVSIPNQSFGTSGTRQQLEATVRDLQERAAQALANASDLANNPIVERSVVVDLHWGLAPATTTITEREITGAERDQRIADANRQAENAQSLADAAAAALAEIP